MAHDDQFARIRPIVVSEKAPTERPPQRWMNPINRIKWRVAIKRRQKTVMLDDGRKFNLNYERIKGKVLITPKVGFHPMCWLDIKRVEQEEADWITDDEKKVR